MEENKGIFTKIKETIINFFNKPKALPTPSQEKGYISIENNDFKKQYDVRKHIEQTNIQQKDIEPSEISDGEPLIEALMRMIGDRKSVV